MSDAILRTEEAPAINNAMPANQNAMLGDKVSDLTYKSPAIIEAAITADATGGLAITVPYDLKIVDVIVQCTAANALGTVTVRNVATAITDAIVCAVNKVIGRAGTIDAAQATLLKGGNLNVVTNGAADRGVVSLVCMRI